MQNENFHIFSPEPRGIQVSSNESQHLYSRGESNCKIEKHIDNFKQFFPQEKLSSVLS